MKQESSRDDMAILSSSQWQRSRTQTQSHVHGICNVNTCSTVWSGYVFGLYIFENFVVLLQIRL